MSFKSGFVSIVGRPNVGKSTLLNQILKTKLAIMSDVAQTTRNTIQGIYTDDEAQIIFVLSTGCFCHCTNGCRYALGLCPSLHI